MGTRLSENAADADRNFRRVAGVIRCAAIVGGGVPEVDRHIFAWREMQEVTSWTKGTVVVIEDHPALGCWVMRKVCVSVESASMTTKLDSTVLVTLVVSN